jgi:rhodanese-related sulfurtransferase
MYIPPMNRTLRIVLLSALALGACHRGSASPAAAESAEAALHTVSIDELSTHLANHDNLVVFDVNSRERYEQRHVPGARWAEHDAVHATDLPADHATPLVFYCASERCNACHTAARQAIALGYTNVSILPAGIQGWVAAGKPVTAGPNPA